MSKKPPDHMKGINALPRANGYDATTRFYDEKTNTWITQEQQVAKTGVLPTRIGGSANVGKTVLSLVYDPKTDKWVTREEQKTGARIKGPSMQEIRDAAKAHKTLHIVTPSSCFDSLTWKDGEVTAVFQNGYTYTAPLDLETLTEWSLDSLGKFYNQVLGQDFFSGN
jgi:hypothetical protein